MKIEHAFINEAKFKTLGAHADDVLDNKIIEKDNPDGSTQ